jgi:hypothetical protein
MSQNLIFLAVFRFYLADFAFIIALQFFDIAVLQLIMPHWAIFS